MIDKSGKELFNNTSYREIGMNHNGAAIATNMDRMYVLIDKSGKEIPGTKYGLLIDGTEFSGEEEDLVYFKKNDLYGFMDRRGKVVIAPKFSGVPALRSDGYAEVELNERKVLINQKRQGLVKHILA